MKKQLNALRTHWQRRHWRTMVAASTTQVANAMQDVPPALQTYWQTHGAQEFPGMPTDERSWAWSLRGLMTYFFLAASSPHQTLLPSRAADSIWHAWIEWDAQHLMRFQQRHFGKAMPHLETKDMPASSEQGALPRTWALACVFEGKPVLSGTIPFIFALDRVLDMPQGWHYKHNTNTRQIEIADIGATHLHNVRVAHGLTAASFAALGLISLNEAQAWQKGQKEQDSDSGGGCGIGIAGASCGSSDSGGGDGGSCGGGGCGGGGCG